jgi:drug/metabolite transporter (DMT)-like permease
LSLLEATPTKSTSESGPVSFSKSRPLDALAIAGAILCCALWGGNAVAVKAVVGDVPPIGLAGIRFCISIPVIGWIASRTPNKFKIQRKHWWLVPIHGLFLAAQVSTFNWGTSHGQAGRSSVFINVHPLVVTPLSVWILHEHVGWKALTGLASAFSGVIVLVAGRLMAGGDPKADVIVFCSGCLFGIQSVFQKWCYRKVAPASLLFWQTPIAILICFLGTTVFESEAEWKVSQSAVLAIMYQGLAVSGVCFSVWSLLLGRYEAASLAALGFMTPLFGISLGTWIHAEPVTSSLILGAALIGFGVYLTAIDKRKRKVPA